MDTPLHCEQCDAALVDGRCPSCGAIPLFRFVQREIVALVVLCAIAVMAFAVTRSIAAGSSRIRQRDAAEWYRIGQSRLERGQPEEAAEALRRASAMDRDSRVYRLALATALASADRGEAARQVLVGMRALAPESPEVNLRLARLEAQRGEDDVAVRYYQSALYGLWDPGHTEQRRRLRVEFIEYLLDLNQRSHALAELVALEGNLVEEPRAHIEAARLFSEAGDHVRALTHYEHVLRLDPRNADAFAGAGEAAFRLGDYPRAHRYLRAAPADHPGVSELRSVAALVLSRDPLMPRLAFAERRRRLQAGLVDALARIANCPADGDRRLEIEELQRAAREVEARLRRQRPPQTLETIEAGFDVVYRIQLETADRCGPQGPADRALLIIGQRHRADHQ